MEVQGLTNQAEYDRIRALTKVTSPDAARKIAGFLNKVTFISVLWNRNYFLRFRFRLLTSYGFVSGSGSIARP
jgi:hypothetical protein